MSYTSTVIDKYCQAERGRLSSLVAATGLHSGNLSRLRSGSRAPTIDMIERLIPVVDPDTAVQLAVAWLRDQLPSCASALVNIHPCKSKSSEPIMITDLDRAWPILQAETEHNHELQRVILNLARLVQRIHGLPAITEPTALAAEDQGEYKAER
jgi:2-phospho-L-lactate transferase/gluconeogenesis factor (CofD/UPF0052 family)